MFAPGDCQIVVTYRDGNLVWKDSPIEQADIVASAINATERAVHCFVPTFWSHIHHASRIEHVGVTAKGRTLQLPWPPNRDLAALPALSLDIRLHYDGRGLLTEVRWA
jgi:hypothetical protein